MVEPHPSREHPSSSDVAEVDDDRLFEILHAHLSDPSRGGIDDLLRDHPEQRERLLTLHADYQLAQSLVGRGVAAGRHASVLDELNRTAAPGHEYRDLGLLARGGMAEIRRVRDVRLDRTLVKKILPVAVHATPLDARLVRRLARFLGEARVMSGLQHPAILTVVDFGVDEQGRPFLVMPEVEGRTLDAVFADLRGGHGAGTAMVQVVQTLLPACEAVAYAHACGVVHRDLKPSNIMVGRFGEVRVMDWGLAKRIGEPDRRTPSDGDANPSTWTRTGDQIGTPAYMAPEQASGDRDAVGAHTDQYALGAILYEGLTGRRPFADQLTETTTLAVLAAIRHSLPTPLHRLAPNVPPELAAIVSKSIARSPSDRYPTVAAMVEDLRAFLETRVVAAYGRGPWQTLRQWVRRNRGLAIGIAGVLVTVIGALVTLNLLQSSHRTSLQATNRDLDVARQEAVDHLARLQGHLYRQQLAAALRLYEDGESTFAIGEALQACPEPLRGFEWRMLQALSVAGEPMGQCQVGVTALAIAADGRTFVAGGPEGIEVWEVAPPARRFQRPTAGPVYGAAMNAAADLLAVTTVDGRLQTFTLASGEPRWAREAAPRAPVVISADGHVVFTVLADGAVGVLAAQHGTVVRQAALGAGVSTLALAPRDALLAAAGPEQCVLADAGTLAPRWTKRHGPGRVDMLQFDGDARSLHLGLEYRWRWRLRVEDGGASQTEDWGAMPAANGGRAVLHDRFLLPIRNWLGLRPTSARAWPTRMLAGHRADITAHALAFDHAWGLSAGSDGEVRRWSLETQAWRALRALDKEMLRVALSPDGARVAAVGWDPDLWMWDVASGRLLLKIPQRAQAKRAVGWTGGGDGILGVASDNRLCEWDSRTGELRRRFDLTIGWASPLAMSPSRHRFLTVDQANEVILVDVVSGLSRKVGVFGRNSVLAWTPDDRSFFCSDADTLYRFDADTATRAAAIRLAGACCVAASSDGILACGDKFGRAHLLHPSRLEVLHSVAPHFGAVTGMVFVPGERRLITVGYDRQLFVLDPDNGCTLLRMLPDACPLHSVELSPDGCLLVLGGTYGEVFCLRIPPAVATPR